MRSALFRRYLVTAVASSAAVALLLTGCTAQGQEPSGDPSDRSSAEETSAPEDDGEAEGDAEETEEPAEQVLLDFGDESDQVRELQARLGQLGHFAAQPTGYYGDVTLGAVSEYQRSAGFEVSGTVYESTWAALTEATSTPTDEELYPPQQVMGYGDNSDQVRELQARLKQLGHFEENPTGYYGDVTTAAVTAYQQAAGLEATGTVFEPTWDALTAETETPTEEEMFPPLEVPEVEPVQDLDERCLTGRVLCISKTTSTLSWVIDGEVQMTVDVRFGAEETPTREGEFEVYWKSRNHHSTLYDSPMPYAMFFDGGQAVHYSQDFAANGYNGASHGCVNVRDEAAIAELFDDVREGDRVIVYW
ncbi:L,D-transpeptidase family protein [Streptomyces litchfieldiae]|uniref:Peptidoglycan-binding protein n=1 Tax=Streptomyces litchfieldiae TaxID=3075543 RepID=A0ABU2MTF0_9ACTN|nr:peptidoglycan-binding protein [Streptomyces sp. DSM 44938]MDT0344913.1 peptidoglycan-binding protein [Streptomyces sp. DSM 44938]